MASVAEEIRNMANKLESLYKKPQVNEGLDDIADQAQQAFWAVIAQRFPGAHTGDFPPDAQHAFDQACSTAVKTWVMYNVANHGD